MNKAEDVIERALGILTVRAQKVLLAAQRVDARLLNLPPHMAVRPEVFELVSLMTAHINEAIVNMDRSLVSSSGEIGFTAVAENSPTAFRIAILALAEQKIESCEQMIIRAQKMVEGDMDVWGKDIVHGGSWGK